MGVLKKSQLRELQIYLRMFRNPNEGLQTQEEGIVVRLVKMILSTKNNEKTEQDHLWLKKAPPSASSARYLPITK